MRKIHILAVDDTAFVRRLVTDALNADPQLEIVATAANGRLALDKLDQMDIDCVLLDVEMPDMDGLEALAEIRRRRPRMPVIMFSTMTERGAAVTLEALTLGANDYVQKPSHLGGPQEALNFVRRELGTRVKALCKIQDDTGALPARKPEPARPALRVVEPAAPAPRARARYDILAIGTSTGGPEALSTVLAGLPPDLPVPVVIVQHMPATFTKLLADRLAKKTGLTVMEVQGNEALRPGAFYLAPGDKHMTLKREGTEVRVKLNTDAPENSCRPSVDVLFRSVADVYGRNTLSLVMTGMGSDGLKGCEVLRAAGGRILVQDEESSVVWGMPGYVAQAGLADQILPLKDISHQLLAELAYISRGASARDGELRARHA